MIRYFLFLLVAYSKLSAGAEPNTPPPAGGAQQQTQQPQNSQTGQQPTQKPEEAPSKKPLPVKFDPLNESAPEEILVFQELSKRSEELRGREEAFKVKTLNLKAAETALEEKLKNFDTLKQELVKLLDTLKEKDEKQFKDLVTIFSSMKPKQAASILNQMDFPTLKEIIKRMAQKKAAVILASMDTRKARELTHKLANDGQKIG